MEEEVYVVSLWWECRPVIRRSCRQVDDRRSSEVRGEESSRAEKRVTKVWMSVRLENLHPPDDGTGEQKSDSGRAVSNLARSPIIPSWAQPDAVHHLSPTTSPKELRGVGGPGLKSGVMGLKMKGVAASPEAGPSYRPDEVGCSTIGPVSLSNKGPNQQPDIGVKTREGPFSSAGQDHNIS